MNQEWLIQRVLNDMDSVPPKPEDDRSYLSHTQAQRIVDETLDYLGAHSKDLQSETEYTYIKGHRKRLAHTLTMIPKAEQENQSCLDVGSYGYMGFWMHKHLGYGRVLGIEWHPDIDDDVIRQDIRVGDDSIEFESYNFDITQEQWPIDEEFDTVLFLEVLEHINQDPMGVMERIHARLKHHGTLVMSVPNAISYKAFHEFLVGMPPWTYWFYEPDLSHEPRHCFEYTPIVFKALIGAAGLQENAFRTIYAYSDPEREAETLEVAQSFGIDVDSFGETMIIHATKTQDHISIRYPDVLYSPDGYYRNIFPQLQQRFRNAVDHYREHTDQSELKHQLEEQIIAKDNQLCTLAAELESSRKDLASANSLGTELQSQINALLYTCDTELSKQRALEEAIEEKDKQIAESQIELQQTQDWAHNLLREKNDLEARVNELLFTCDCYLRKERESEMESKAAYDARDHSLSIVNDTKAWAESLSKENADLTCQVNELLFACDCYLQQINDPQRCIQVVRERRFRSALEASKSVARKTPVLRTALRPVYRSTKKFIKRRM